MRIDPIPTCTEAEPPALSVRSLGPDSGGGRAPGKSGKEALPSPPEGFWAWGWGLGATQGLLGGG